MESHICVFTGKKGTKLVPSKLTSGKCLFVFMSFSRSIESVKKMFAFVNKILYGT